MNNNQSIERLWKKDFEKSSEFWSEVLKEGDFCM